MADASSHGNTVPTVSSGYSREVAISRLVQKLGLSPHQGERLFDAGLVTPEDVRAAPDDRLKAAGLSEEDIGNIRGGTPMAGGVSDDLLEKWLENRARTSRRSRSSRGAATAAAQEAAGNDDSFRRWVAGDDSAFASWLKPQPKDAPPEPAVPAEAPKGPDAAPAPPKEGGTVEPSAAPQTQPSSEASPTTPGAALPAPELSPIGAKDEEFATWLKTVTEVLRTKDGAADIESLEKVGERYAADLRTLKENLAHMADTLMQVRKGAVAQIKFVRTKEIRLREEAVAAKEAEIASLRDQLEDLKTRGGPATGGDRSKEGKGKPVPSSIATMMEGVRAREKILSLKEQELQAKDEELRLKLNEAEKLKNPLQLREQEISKWEQDLRIKDEQLKLQMRKLEADRKATQDPQTLEKLRKIEDLESEISRKESDIKAKENYLLQRLEELQGKERQVVDLEVEKQETDFARETKAERAKTGVRRLDDLLIGGLPIGCNVLINGSKHTGKEVLAMYLVAEGLRRMVPALWVLTDTDPETIRAGMTAILPTYLEYERRGLVRYIDLYSMNLGITTSDEYVTLISITEPGALEKLSQATETQAQKFLEKSKYYRLIFQTISTATAQLEIPAMMRFLQPYAGKRRREKAVSYFLVETGMHEEGDIDFLGHLMDGSIELKVEQMKTFLSVKGILDSVQSRAWISYTFSKTTFEMGSFSLDHIR